ncbi:NlpC/P60 family protein [Streptomyces sp. NBC_00083]|uniref:C40 family peptidase n=1 Tax=Streptomyces sp. NBC_00083 TaxID=2975647 RepID=UPI0022503B13|nr:C40 family peptidase [Streptomyces sp. NBC_00083]MCX5382915.1 NlpC/P60 family protein [Streptomyces sp. NBC_00083]
MASHRRPSQSGLTQSARVTVLSAAAATAAAAFAAPGASAAPHEPAPSGKATVDRLFEQAEQATEQYDKADEHAKQLREQVKQAQDAVARGQEKINRMRGALGAIAGAQYRSGGIDPALALLLSSNPDTYLDRAVTFDRLSERQTGQLHELQHEQRRLAQQRAEAGRKLAELERSRTEVARHKRTVESKLAQARRLLNALPTADRAAFDRASRSGRTELPPLAGAAPASSRAAAAVMAARSAIGKPYIWGANGPSGFDCSGLMQWSYARAGVGLPRTSQEQRYAGHQVPLSEAKPGDLVAYRHDASHIAMYVGNGQVVHAPYPGAPVRYDPVGMMPISSVTRV